MVFKKEYASIYDTLYQGKDYKKECDFLEKIFTKQKKEVRTVLDLGCGTGGHALILAKRGYKVTGVDRSGDMLRTARKNAKKAGLKIDYHRSSIQGLKLNKKFDAVIAMFAVMGYQTENKDLALACKNAKAHLKRGGCFIFDAWHGPAVLTDPPTEVVKDLESGDERIIRYTRPDVDVIAHTVDVNFKVSVLKNDRIISKTKELHKMRFLFPQETKYFLQAAGFKNVTFMPFLKTGKKLSVNDWNMTVVAG